MIEYLYAEGTGGTDRTGGTEGLMGGWVGPYTVGQISVKGTRVWIRPRDEIETFHYPCVIEHNMEELEILISLLEELKNAPKLGEYYTDELCHREENLDIIINWLRHPMTSQQYLTKVMQEECKCYCDPICPLNHPNCLYHQDLSELEVLVKGKLVVSEEEEFLVTTTFDKQEDINEVIQELEQVRDYFTAKGIEWIWV